jgi:hypothetical protein
MHPEIMDGINIGRTIVVIICDCRAPRSDAASSNDELKPSRPAYNGKIINGR